MDLDNDKEKQDQIRADCEMETKTLDANLVAYAEKDSLLESKIQKDELELNESKKVAGGDLGKIKKCERKVETLAGELPEGAKKIGAARKRLKEIMYMFSPEEQDLAVPSICRSSCWRTSWQRLKKFPESTANLPDLHLY